MARHKYASNVIEKALKQAEGQERRDLIDELIGAQPDGNDQILKLLKDAYGNFPVQVRQQNIVGGVYCKLIAVDCFDCRRGGSTREGKFACTLVRSRFARKKC